MPSTKKKKRAPAARPKKKPAKRPVKAGVVNQRQKVKKRIASKATVKQRKNSEGRKRSLANLRPFKPGQSGNPNGRPKSTTVSDALRQALKGVDSRDGRTLAQVVAEELIALATKGRGGHIKIRAIQEIVDRVEGKPRQSVEVFVPKSEIDRYEAMINEYLQAAKDQGIELTREQAINYLASADNRILTVLGAASEYAQ